MSKNHPNLEIIGKTVALVSNPKEFVVVESSCGVGPISGNELFECKTVRSEHKRLYWDWELVDIAPCSVCGKDFLK